MRAIIFLMIGYTSIACENQEVDQKNSEQSYQQWHTYYMNSRQNDDVSELCDEYYQDCINAGYPEESCNTRLEECEEYDEQSGDREDDTEGNNEETSACEEEAQEALEECVEEGGSSEDCRMVYAETYDDCVERE